MRDGQLQTARERLAAANTLLIVTGAGVSAESGVPTFRDPKGLWSRFDPMKVATPEAFAANPKAVWEWYDARRTQMRDVKPNPAHFAVAELQRAKADTYLLTQNVDDLHEQAGSPQAGHIHGSIWETRCPAEGVVRPDRRAPLPEIPPKCETCGGLVRPNVVWFGELIREDVIDEVETFLGRHGEADVVMVIGTEASFHYILSWANQARGASGTLIEINPSVTGITPAADIHLQGPAGEILPQLV